MLEPLRIIDFLTSDLLLSRGVQETIKKLLPTIQSVRVWGVFLLCLVFSAVGVGLSFWVLGGSVTGYRLWGIGLVIAVTMLGISYGAKYANADARETFTPIDLIQYLTQGFLWPSTWPALADFLGVSKIAPPPHAANILFETARQLMVG